MSNCWGCLAALVLTVALAQGVAAAPTVLGASRGTGSR